jgi:CHAT domain-containing protein
MFQRFWILISVFFLLSPANYLRAQESNASDMFNSFANYYNKGDYINAEKCLIGITEIKDSLSNEYLIAAYNNLGVINILLGRYEDALRNLNFAESKIRSNEQSSLDLADIFINKARIYGIIKESDKAIEYLEQGIKIYLTINKPDKSVLFRISTAYLNLGLTFFEKKNYNSALHYLEKSKYLKLKYNLTDIALVYLNIAKTYAKVNNHENAEKYFLESIKSFNVEFGKDYDRLAEAYFDYGLFLQSIGKNHETFEIQQKALSICLKRYGDKHTLVSLSYKLLGDHMFYQKNYQAALKFYQKSLIAVVSDFNDTNIYSNPSLGKALFNTRLLGNLKRKAQTLELLSKQQLDICQRLQILIKSYETIDLALQLIARIRSGYVSFESQTYLSENEKETYFFAIHIAQLLYENTNNPEYLERMYNIACASKSGSLRNEIIENELLFKHTSTDSLDDKRNRLIINIASYSKLLQDELQKNKPDSKKIDFWKDALFDMNRKKEKVDEKIKMLYPYYDNQIQKANPIIMRELQNYLSAGETLIDYFLSNQYNNGKRELYIFTVSHSKIEYHLTYLDSNFISSVDCLKQAAINNQNTTSSKITYKSHIDALNDLYKKLILPVEANLEGNTIIIVPDEEIAYLPFDAFIREKPESDQVDYEGLKYLIYDYTISYGYTSSLIFKNRSESNKTSLVYTFSPDYGDNQSNIEKDLIALHGVRREISSISKFFNGRNFDGGEATESNFKHLIKKSAIFHLAMHSQTDKTNSKYSYLIFDNRSDTIEDGRLFNYEIGTSRIVSPMIVLSACNTGNGDLYQGEGLMSLTRGFILAGASSVINTFWDVNDEASAVIMTNFYSHLSKGDAKDIALRLSKLEYLKSTSPTYANPFYWAAYKVMGDKSPIKSGTNLFLICLGVFLFLGVTIYLVYFKWFRSS